LALSNPTLPEITDGYEIQLHHSLGHDRHPCGQRKGVFPISIGVATFSHNAAGADAGRLVRRADEALYTTKASGRDCVRSWTPTKPQLVGSKVHWPLNQAHGVERPTAAIRPSYTHSVIQMLARVQTEWQRAAPFRPRSAPCAARLPRSISKLASAPAAGPNRIAAIKIVQAF
jgi:hypothetical protein